MIKFRENSKEGLYSISVYQDGRLVTNQSYLDSKGKYYHNDDDILISLEELGREIIIELPQKTGFFMMKDIPETYFMVTRLFKKEKSLVLELTADEYTFKDSSWNSRYYVKSFSKLNNIFNIIGLEYEESKDAQIVLLYEKEFSATETIGDFLNEVRKGIISISNQVELEQKGFKWKEGFQTSESLFCKEVLTPLFQKMSLLDFKFTHGQNEHGKDYVFSERTKFDTINHSAVQVKAGNLDGKTQGKLKEIIAQLDDAFTIPYSQINESGVKYIDTFYVIVSGKITDGAIVKIKNKIKPELKGSIKFLDKDAIMNLVYKYWK